LLFHPDHMRAENAQVETLTSKVFVLTNYEYLTSKFFPKGIHQTPSTSNVLFRVSWNRVGFDEGHVARNPRAGNYRAIMGLKALRRWEITGTPFQNSDRDLACLSAAAGVKDHPFSLRATKNTVPNPKLRPAEKEWRTTHVLRRTKEELKEHGLLPDVPHKHVHIVPYTLTEEETKTYETMDAKWEVLYKAWRAAAREEKGKAYMAILVHLLRMRQVLDDPLLCFGRSLTLPFSRDRSFVRLSDDTLVCFNCKDQVPPVALDDDSDGYELEEESSWSMRTAKSKSTTASNSSLKRKPFVHTNGSNKKHKRGNAAALPSLEESAAMLSLEKSATKPKANTNASASLKKAPRVIHNLVDSDNEEGNEERDKEEKDDVRFHIPFACSHRVCKGCMAQLGSACRPDRKCPLCCTHVDSSRTQAIVKILRGIPAGEKTVVFSQWTSYMDLLEKALIQAGISYVRMDGDVQDSEERKQIKTDFAETDIQVFLGSTKAGGLGLNLVAANHLILADTFYNPFVDRQAMDRVWRIGQTREVHLYRLNPQDGTGQSMGIERWLGALQRRKACRGDQVLDNIELTGQAHEWQKQVEDSARMGVTGRGGKRKSFLAMDDVEIAHQIFGSARQRRDAADKQNRSHSSLPPVVWDDNDWELSDASWPTETGDASWPTKESHAAWPTGTNDDASWPTETNDDASWPTGTNDDASWPTGPADDASWPTGPTDASWPTETTDEWPKEDMGPSSSFAQPLSNSSSCPQPKPIPSPPTPLNQRVSSQPLSSASPARPLSLHEMRQRRSSYFASRVCKPLEAYEGGKRKRRLDLRWISGGKKDTENMGSTMHETRAEGRWISSACLIRGCAKACHIRQRRSCPSPGKKSSSSAPHKTSSANNSDPNLAPTMGSNALCRRMVIKLWARVR
jgi:hypothetical protein